jgi:hypothetical protein
MTIDHARSYFLPATLALLSAACISSSTTGSTGSGGGSSSASASGSGGSGSGGSGGGAACQAATLVGALSIAGGWQAATLDPATGAIGALNPIASATAFVQSGSAYDPATKHLYLIGVDSADHPTVFTIDGLTGATLAAATLPDHSVTNPEVVGGGAIMALHQPSGTWQTATLDAAMGTVAPLLPLPDNGFTMSRGFNPLLNHLYEIGSHDGTGNIFTINATTGALLLDVPLSDVHFSNAVVNGAGQILGLHGGGGTWSVARLNPTTGAITNLAPVSLTGILSGMGTFDPCTNRMYQLTSNGVLTADGTSGAVISLVSLPAQANFATIEAVW